MSLLFLIWFIFDLFFLPARQLSIVIYNQMIVMMTTGTWRKFLCLHWKAPLGEELGPRSNISPAHTLAEVKDKRKLRILWFGQEENTSYFSSITLSSTQTRTLRQSIKTILLVIHYNIFLLFVCLFVQLVLFCVTICMTRCQKCTRLALTTSRICQIITSKFCTMHQISNHHGEV